jgi:hypothetical protein
MAALAPQRQPEQAAPQQATAGRRPCLVPGRPAGKPARAAGARRGARTPHPRAARQQPGGAGPGQQERQHGAAGRARRRDPVRALAQPDRQRGGIGQRQRRRQHGRHQRGGPAQEVRRDRQPGQPRQRMRGQHARTQQQDGQAHGGAVQDQERQRQRPRARGSQHRRHGGEGDQSDHGRTEHQHRDFGGTAQARGEPGHRMAGKKEPESDVGMNHAARVDSSEPAETKKGSDESDPSS